ncbi:MAG: glycosyltransferase family 2 protein [Myxococcota bacterium]
MNSKLNVVVGIATAGRREQLALTLRVLARQRQKPERVLVCPAAPEDFDDSQANDLPFPVQIVTGPRGLCAQRNAILRACRDADLLFLFDDDFYPACDYIEQAVALFATQPDVVMATHHPKLDGATSSGITHDEALVAVERFDRSVTLARTLRNTYAGYGCNMVVRLAPVRQHDLWFDENLPLYSWLEDVDFSRRLSPYGRIVVDTSLRGVHLGTKRGRTSGVRLGYSQIANPLYMLQKGSLSLPYALRQMARNLAKNSVRALWPEPWVDRVGRCRGNVIALRHLLTGQLHPLNAVKLP